MNWPLVFILGWAGVGLTVCVLLYRGDRRREAEALAELREELRDTFESVCREMAVEEHEYRAKVEAAPYN